MVKPTSYKFMGVGENRMQYKRMLYNVADNIVTKVTIAVYGNRSPCMLIGNYLIGGLNSWLEVVGMNAVYSFYMLLNWRGQVVLV